MRKPGSIFLLSIVLGALFAALVYRHLRAQQDAVELARRAAGGDTVDVLVANGPIPMGTRVEANQVRMAAWPVDLQPTGVLRASDTVVGRIARTSIEANQPVLESQLIAQGSGLLPLLITEGMRAMSVKVDSVTGVSGFITPNSRVDVLVAGNPDGQGGGEQRSKLVLQNVRVLATGTTIEQKDEKPVEVPTVTLLVSPDEAEKLTLATRQEPVRLALRNFKDEAIIKTKGISTPALFASDTPEAAPRVARATSAPAPEKPSVEVLLGDKVTRQPIL
jgi:pilus assembly protein CpaB